MLLAGVARAGNSLGLAEAGDEKTPPLAGHHFRDAFS